MQPASTHFQTDRLTASAFTFQDLDELCRLHQDGQVMRTLGGVRSAEQTERFLAEKIEHWQTHGFGYWMFRHKASNEFVGRAGLQHIHIGGRNEIEIGYTVARAHWGQGYATEMAQAMIDVAFQQLALPMLVCFTLTTNLPSQRVMCKVGFTFEREVIHADQPHVLYRLNRESAMGN